MKGLTVGFALTGSFCTVEQVLPQMEKLAEMGADIVPIISYALDTTDTRFGTAEGFKKRIREISGKEPLATITEAEPIGPKALLDVLVVAPCTGNTLANMMVKRPYDKLAPEDHPLTLEDVQGWLTRLATMTPEERARLAGMPPTRVHILPTGLVILREVMAQLGIGQLRVTQRTNLDGYLYRLVAMPQEDHDA